MNISVLAEAIGWDKLPREQQSSKKSGLGNASLKAQREEEPLENLWKGTASEEE